MKKNEPRRFWIADTDRYVGCQYCSETYICGDDPKDSAKYEGNTLDVTETWALDALKAENTRLLDLLNKIDYKDYSEIP